MNQRTLFTWDLPIEVVLAQWLFSFQARIDEGGSKEGENYGQHLTQLSRISQMSTDLVKMIESVKI